MFSTYSLIISEKLVSMAAGIHQKMKRIAKEISEKLVSMADTDETLYHKAWDRISEKLVSMAEYSRMSLPFATPNLNISEKLVSMADDFRNQDHLQSC